MEVWKAIPGYEGFYEVSDLGRVKRIKVSQGACKRVLRPAPNRQGYPCVDLYVGAKRRKWKVHRLVLRAFVGPSDLHTNHKDGKPSNPRLVNLEYVTKSDNEKHKINVLKRGNIPYRGASNFNALHPDIAKIKHLRSQGLRLRDIVAVLGYRNDKVVIDVLKGRHWSQRRPERGSNAG